MRPCPWGPEGACPLEAIGRVCAKNAWIPPLGLSALLTLGFVSTRAGGVLPCRRAPPTRQSPRLASLTPGDLTWSHPFLLVPQCWAGWTPAETGDPGGDLGWGLFHPGRCCVLLSLPSPCGGLDSQPLASRRPPALLPACPGGVSSSSHHHLLWLNT